MYTVRPLGLTAAPKGLRPTGIVATTVLVPVLTTETSLEPELAIYARGADMGVAVMIAVMDVLPVFIARKEGILPNPFIGRPAPGALLVQV
jgi:hypothetical protein